MPTVRTAVQAGWTESRYNIFAWPPGGDDPIVANLYAGTMGKVPLLEYALLKSLDELPATHPVLERLAERGLIVDFDERARLEERRAGSLARQRRIRLTICPTMACNFDCPYCFQVHRAATMSEAVQDDVAALAEKLLATSGAEELSIVWYGGEPLLAPTVIRRLTRLLEAACSKHGAGIRASVLTNGYLLDREMARMLAASRVKSARVTVDGLGPTHDATRHLAGGGNTFERIMENLSARIPFPVEVRMNVHASNIADVDALRTRVADIARESGNKLVFREAHVYDSEAALSRDEMPQLLDEQSLKRLSLDYGSMRLHGAKARCCTAQAPFNVSVDEKGRLFACDGLTHDPQYTFGNAATWDPARPEDTATHPENRHWFIRGSLDAVADDEECQACIWLPVCVGGCPKRRMAGQRECVFWKDDPESFVLAQYANMGEKRRDVKVGPEEVGRLAAPVLRKFGVARAWVYGSFALGCANAHSDVDLIVEMPPDVVLGRSFFDLRRELKEAFGRKVDLHLPPNDSARTEYVRVLERTKALVFDERSDG